MFVVCVNFILYLNYNYSMGVGIMSVYIFADCVTKHPPRYVKVVDTV